MSLRAIRGGPRDLVRRNRRPLLEALEQRWLLASYTTPEDTLLTVADAGLVGAVIVTRPEHGQLTLTNTGGFAYAPAPNYNGPDRFLYTKANTTNAGTIAGETTEVSITVTPVNDAPEARPDEYQTFRGVTLTIAAPGVLNNDTDVDHQDLKAKVASQPANGTLVLNENGGFTYTPKADFAGLDSFTYVATDGSLDSNAARVSINVRLLPSGVVANDDTYSALPGKPLEIAAPGVLKNDFVLFATPTDPATGATNGTSPVNFPLIARVVEGSGPRHGTLTLNLNGAFVYTPAAGFTGADTFVYTASLATTVAGTTNSLSDTATVTINVRGLPDARDDQYSVLQNGVLTVPAKGVLANDVPVTEFGLVATLEPGDENKPQHGTVELKTDGSFVYTPASGYSGPDRFVYRATDATPTLAGSTSILPGAYDLATVYIFVRPSPIVVARPDFYETRVSTPITVAPPGVLGNDYVLYADPVTGTIDGTPGTRPPLVATLLTNPPPAGLSFNASGDGGFTYAPPAGFSGEVKFSYQAKLATATGGSTTTGAANPADSNQQSDIATVTIFVRPLPLPVANDDFYRMLEGTTLTVAAPGVLANDRGADNQQLKAVLNQGPPAEQGTLELKADGSFTFTPKPDVTGYVTFTYYALDQNASPPTTPPTGENGLLPPRPINLATVRIFVYDTNPPVYARDDFYSVLVDGVLNVEAPGVLKNDSLIPPPPILVPYDTTTVANVTTDPNVPGTSPFNFTITAALLNDPPPPAGLTFRPDGSFSYDPPDGVSGEVKFRYQATASATPATDLTAATALGTTHDAPCYLDAAGAAICPPQPDLDNIATVTIYVRPPEPPPGPVARDDFYLTAANTTLAVRAPGVLANDYVRGLALPATDAQPAIYPPPLLAVLVAGPENGVLTLNEDGSFNYEPDAGFTGIDTFTYQASLSPLATDATTAGVVPVLSEIATVTIRVAPALAHNDTYTTLRDVKLDVGVDRGVLANDDGGSEEFPLSAVLITEPLHGELKLNADGSFSYVPDPNFTGVDLFVYRAETELGQPTDPGASGEATTSDANNDRPGNVAIVRIYVRAPQPTVHAYPDRYATPKDTPLEVEKPGVLANDYALVNHRVVASLGQRDGDAPLHGEVIVNADGSFTYTPDAGFAGEDRFIYKATDLDAAPSSSSETVNFSYATVVIHVLADGTVPKFLPGSDQRTTDESGQQRVAEWATIVAVSGGGNPAFVVSTDKPHLFAQPPAIDATGQLTYAAAPNASGLATVTVLYAEGEALDPDSSATFTIQIDKPNPLHNTALACDVTNDSVVAANDVVAIINYINAGLSSTDAGEGEAGATIYYDVSKDGHISAIDALMVINEINAGSDATPDGGGAEGESAAATDASLLALLALDATEATLGKRRPR